MFKYVLDSSALLAVIFEEPGSDSIEPLFEFSVLPIINYTECLTKLLQNNYELEAARINVLKVIPHILEYTLEIATTTALLDKKTKEYGLSFGDRACIATAIHNNYEVLTTDRSWSNLSLPVKIHQMR